MSTIFGRDATNLGPGAAAAKWLGGSPADQKTPQQSGNGRPESPMVAWCRRTGAALKRERQQVTEEMRRNVNLAQGGTPWWKERPKWKIGTKLNKCATIPLTWTSILCDAKPSVSYTALDRAKQKRADIATAAWDQAYIEHNWERAIHDAVLVSRVQKKAYLSLRPHLKGGGAQVEPRLLVVLGEQVFLNKSARSVDDAEVLLYEYPESYGSLCARFPGLRAKLRRKYQQRRDAHEGESQSVLSPPAAYALPTGSTVYTPAYGASPNPPDGDSGSAGLWVREFWTRPHSSIDVDEVQFLSSGEPATRPKMYETVDPADAEPLRRIVTEGGVIYELPESVVNAMYDAQDAGGIRILEDQPALEAITHQVRYPLYPDGRLVVIVDDDVEADDRMNPLGYIPFAEIDANSDPGGGQYGPSDVDLIADAYENLIRLVCLVHDTANLTGNTMWRVWVDEDISNDDFTNAPGGITRESIQSLKYSKREAAPQLPAYIIQQIRWLDEQIDKLAGLSDMATGKMPPKAQVSTETVTMAQEASGVRFRDALASVSRAMRTLGAQFLEFMARFYTSPVIVQVKNDAGIPEPLPMLGSYLTEPLIVEAKAGSRQPSGPSARLNTLLNLKNAGVPLPLTTVYAILEELGTVHSATAVMREVELLKNDPRQTWKLLGIGQPGQQAKKPNSRRSKKQPPGVAA